MLNPEWLIVNTHTANFEAEFTVTGELLNNALTPQEDVTVTGIFYNEAGDIIDNVESTVSYLPLGIIPVDIQIPFQLSAQTTETVSRYELQVTSTAATSDPPRDDFEVSGIETWNNNGEFCLKGLVENQGEPVQNSLIILAKLYNATGEMFGFAQVTISRPDTLQEGATAPFETCIPQGDNTISQYDVVALGR